jgi:tetratricopeptide (TPR) repeat protein
MGLWNDVVAANIRARDVQNAREAELGRPDITCGHYTSWLHYGWLMRNDLADADRGMAECRARVTSGSASAGDVSYFVSMRARHVLYTRDWAAAAQLDAEVDHPGYHFVTAYAAIKLGDEAGARAAMDRMRNAGGAGPTPRLLIAEKELEAMLALDRGDGPQAIALLREATAIEEGLPFEFGPPASLKPPHELLGEVAAELGDHDTALAAFRNALNFTPERTLALEGLVEAARALSLEATALDAKDRLDRIRRGDSQPPS